MAVPFRATAMAKPAVLEAASSPRPLAPPLAAARRRHHFPPSADALDVSVDGISPPRQWPPAMAERRALTMCGRRPAIGFAPSDTAKPGDLTAVLGLPSRVAAVGDAAVPRLSIRLPCESWKERSIDWIAGGVFPALRFLLRKAYFQRMRI